jgi:hypothetical protein
LRLIELAAEGKKRAWWQRLSLPYSDYVGLEAAAESISDYGVAVVPGLLQTPDYARAVLRDLVPALPSKVVEERVQARVERQRRRFSRPAPNLEAVLDESVLHRAVGNPAVMVAQLERLLEMSQRPQVTIRVVPYDAGVVPASHKFIILRFAEPETDIVHIEDLTGHRNLKRPNDVQTYKATFHKLIGLSAEPAVSLAMVSTKLRAYESKIR